MARRLPSDFLPTLGRLRRWLAVEDGLASRHLGSSLLGVAVILILIAAFLTLVIRERAADDARSREFAVLRAASAAEDDHAALVAAQRPGRETDQRAAQQQVERCRQSLLAHLAVLLPLLHADPERLETLRQIESDLDTSKRAVDAPSPSAIHSSLTAFVRQSNTRLESLNEITRGRRTLQTCVLAVLSAAAMSLLVAHSGRSYRAFRAHLQRAEAATAQHRAIIDNTLDGVITVDERGCIQSLNPAAERMFLQKAADVIGQDVALLIPQRLFLQEQAPADRGALATMGQRQGYFAFPIEVSLSVMEVAGRRQFVAIVRDVSERLKSEDTLRQISLGVSTTTGEEFLRSLLKQLSKALPNNFAFLLELSGRDGASSATLTLAEQGSISQSGPRELRNTAFSEALTKGLRSQLHGVRERFTEDQTLQDLAIESFIAAPLVDHGGRSIGLVGVLDRRPLADSQITESTLQIFAARAAAEIERKRSEEALAAEKERLAVTLRSMADGFITIDNSGAVLMLNAVAENLTGWSQESGFGQPLAAIFRIAHERNRRNCSHALQRIVDAGIAEGLDGPAFLQARDGTERLIEANAAPIRDRAGGRIGAVIVFRDITEKRRMDEEQQKADKLESLGVVAGGIAHDFNNLLTAILGNLSLALLTPELDEVAADRLDAAKRATNRAQELAQQLLTFARGGAPITQTAAIQQLLRDTLSLTLHGSKVLCEFQLADNLWPVEIDPGQISQVINNLAVNASQAMPAGGVLRVQAENFELPSDSISLGLRAGRWVRLSLQDQGIGIPEEYVKKVFDPYFTTKPKGSGLGLATAYSIVKNHRGVIAVDSQPGEGSTFTICLPASENELREANPAPVPLAEGSPRILVLDDEEAICMLVTCALEPLGYAVTETNDGLQAIAAYQKAIDDGRPFDLFISDLTIPGGMGGQETIKRLHQIDPNVRAIVSSGYANDPVMSRHEDYGFCGMIAKPYEIDALGRKVAEIVALPRRPRVIFHDFERKIA